MKLKCSGFLKTFFIRNFTTTNLKLSVNFCFKSFTVFLIWKSLLDIQFFFRVIFLTKNFLFFFYLKSAMLSFKTVNGSNMQLCTCIRYIQNKSSQFYFHGFFLPFFLSRKIVEEYQTNIYNLVFFRIRYVLKISF